MKKKELDTETAQQALPIKKRLLSLDALRGITVAGMILVNNAGGKVSYAPLQHSAWNGLTPCDLVFPFFLFIMGISTYISLNKFNFNVSLQVVTKILKRTFLILCIGWAIGWFDHVCEGDFLPFVHLRIPADRVLAANEKVSGRLMFSIFLRSRAGEPFKELGEERRIFKSQRMGHLLYEHIRNYFGVKVTKGVAFQFMVNNLLSKECGYRSITFMVKLDITF